MKHFLNILGGIAFVVFLFYIVYLTDFLNHLAILLFVALAFGVVYNVFSKKHKSENIETKSEHISHEMFTCSKCNQIYDSANTYVLLGESYSKKIYICRRCNTPPLISRLIIFLWSFITGCCKIIIGILIAYIILRALWGIFNAPSIKW